MSMKPTPLCRRPGIFTALLLACLLVPVASIAKAKKDSFPDPVHGCEIFSKTEIAGLIGAEVDDPPRETHKVQDSGFWMSMCNYYAPALGVSAGIMVQPFFPAGSSPDEAHRNYVQELKSAMPDYPMNPVAGLGVHSFWNGEMKQLTIFGARHLLILTVMIDGSTDEQRLALAEKFGVGTLEKLE